MIEKRTMGNILSGSLGRRGFRLLALWLACLSVAAVAAEGHAASPAWKPTKNVEVVVPTSPGGGTDRTGRLIQKIFHEKKMLGTTSVVVNKPGGGGTIGYVYLNSHAGDGHYIAIGSNPLFSNYIMGKTTLNYTDLTTLAVLFGEYIAFMVKEDSPLKTGMDLISRLKNDPQSVSISIASSSGNSNHVVAGLVGKAAGIDTRRMKIVVFNSGGESITAVLGGHLDVAVQTVGVIEPQLRGKKVRVLGISAPQRIGGVFADVPTWREQGLDVVFLNWRGIMGPKGMSQPQIAYWEDLFAGLDKMHEWKADVEQNLFVSTYMNSRDGRKYLDGQFADFKQILTDLGLAAKK